MNKKWLLLGCVVLAAMALGCGTLGLLFSFTTVGREALKVPAAAEKVEETAKKAKSMGIMLNASMLRPTIPVPDKENAAPAFVVLASYQGRLNAAWRSSRALVRGKDWAGVERLLKQNEDLLKMAKAASTMKRLDFKRDWDLGPLAPDSESFPVRNAAVLLTHRATVLGRRGRTKEAVSDLEAAQRLARTLSEDPAILSQMAARGIRGAVLTAVTRISGWQGEPILSESLAKPFQTDLRKAFLAEAYFSITLSRNPLLGPFAGSDLPTDPKQMAQLRRRFAETVLRDGIPNDTVSRSSLTGSLEAAMKGLAILDSDLPSREKMDRLKRHADGLSTTWMSPEAVGSFAAGGHSNLLRGAVQVEAHEEVVRAYLKALAFRMKKGAFPKALSDLGERFTDPYTGQPLRWAATANGFKVWSVGFNRRDDEGNPAPADARQPRARDIVAEYPPQ